MAAKLTSKQITELGDEFLAIGKNVGDYRLNNREKLSEEENKSLKTYHRSLIDRADELYTTSAALVMDEVDASMNTIKGITTEIDKVYKKLLNVQKAIDIAAAAVNLAAAIFTMKPAAIGKSVLKLVDAVKEDAAPKSKSAPVSKSISTKGSGKKITPAKKKKTPAKKAKAVKKKTKTKSK